jgi:type 1 fimbria pilin
MITKLLRDSLLRGCFCMRKSSLLVVFVILAVASLAFGQVGNGTITGTIIDPTGAVVAGAKVDAMNVRMPGKS